MIDGVGNMYKLSVSSCNRQSNSVNKGVPLIMVCVFSSLKTQR